MSSSHVLAQWAAAIPGFSVWKSNFCRAFRTYGARCSGRGPGLIVSVDEVSYIPPRETRAESTGPGRQHHTHRDALQVRRSLPFKARSLTFKRTDLIHSGQLLQQKVYDMLSMPPIVLPHLLKHTGTNHITPHNQPPLERLRLRTATAFPNCQFMPRLSYLCSNPINHANCYANRTGRTPRTMGCFSSTRLPASSARRRSRRRRTRLLGFWAYAHHGYNANSTTCRVFL